MDSYYRMIQVDIKAEEGLYVSNLCVGAISRIIRSCKKNKDFLVKIEGIVYNMLVHALKDLGNEATDEACDCIALFLYYGGLQGGVS